MGIGGSILAGLSEALHAKAEKAKDREDAQKDQERQNESKIIMAGIQATYNDPTLTDDEKQKRVDQAQEKLKKLYPKDTHEMFDKWGGLLGKVAARKRQLQQSGQAPQTGGTPPFAPGPSGAGNAPQGTRGGGGGAPAPAPAGQSPGAPAQTPTPPPAAPPSAPGADYPDTQLGRQARQESQIDTANATSRLNTLKTLRQTSEAAGKPLTDQEDRALTIWAATGQMPSAAMMGGRKPVSVIGPDGSLVPGMEDADGNVWSNGQLMDNPKLMPKWKPRHGYAKDASGKFFSFSIDPQTNQPVPGSEDYNELPPAAYLDKVRTGMYHWTDDSGNVHESPFTTGSFTKVPSNVQGKSGTPAVPPAFKELPKPKAKTSGAGTGTSTDKTKAAKGAPDRTLGTKDTGVLSPAGQKVLMTTEPVVDQARKLEKIFDDHPELKTNDTPGYLLLPYIAYRMGYATDGALESEIAGLSLGSVIEAASVLQGTSRAVSALRMAMVHTPNAKVDSPKQIYNKLHNDIIPRLDDVMGAAKKYGRKRATASGGTEGDTNAVPPDIKSPPPTPGKGTGTADDPIIISP
jgi:hypothetical protein